ncbi:MAG: hypothetical protein ACC662_05175, partial [Planctomycetota bacterium]
KAGIYFDAGVEEVWLVDPERESVEIRTSGSQRAFRGSEEARSKALAGFGLVPDLLFANLRS